MRWYGFIAKVATTVYHLGTKLGLVFAGVPTVLGYGFAKMPTQVLLGGLVIEGADPKTFQVLSPYYAKDSKFVYYQSSVMENVDPMSFSIIPTKYESVQIAYDKNGFYRDFEKLPLDYKTLRILNENYLSDSKAVFFGSEPVIDADPVSFSALGGGFGVDNNGLWFGTTFIQSVVTATDVKGSSNKFLYLGDLFATDGVTIFRGSKELQGSDPDTFKIAYGSYYAHDKNFVYYGEDPISSHSDGFELIGGYGLYARTINKVLFSGVEIAGADSESFMVADDAGYASDSSHKYYQGNIIATGGR